MCQSLAPPFGLPLSCGLLPCLCLCLRLLSAFLLSSGLLACLLVSSFMSLFVFLYLFRLQQVLCLFRDVFLYFSLYTPHPPTPHPAHPPHPLIFSTLRDAWQFSAMFKNVFFGGSCWSPIFTLAVGLSGGRPQRTCWFFFALLFRLRKHQTMNIC